MVASTSRKKKHIESRDYRDVTHKAARIGLAGLVFLSHPPMANSIDHKPVGIIIPRMEMDGNARNLS